MDAAHTGAAVSYKKKFNFLDFLTKWGTLLVILILLVAFGTTMDTFLTMSNIIAILRAISVVTVISIGLTFSLTVSGMDLSVGSTATCANTICMIFFVWFGWSTFPSMIAALAACLAIAALNILLIVWMKIPDMLATLASMFVFEGVAMTVAGGGAINARMIKPDGAVAQFSVPQAFRSLGREPLIMVFMLVIVVVSFFFLTYTKHGRYLYSVGGNKEAARLSGINVNKYRTLAYLLSTICAALGGMLIGARVGNAQINSGSSYLMGAVAAAHIGMSVAGTGKPNALGTLAGAILIGVLENGLIMASVPYYSVNIFKGLILAIALALNYARKK